MIKMFAVYETFASIQGESTYAGLPCFFIRFAGCNLRCAYCDTVKAQEASAGKMMSENDLLKLVEENAKGIDLVELTGGEPLLQRDLPLLAEKLIAAGKTVLIETNGSVDISALPEAVVRIVDWKGPSSGMEPEMLESNFRILRPRDQVKFVIADDADFDAASAVIRKFDLPSQTAHILFSPAWGSDVKHMAERIVTERLPVRVNLQFHKYIWGPTVEGV